MIERRSWGPAIGLVVALVGLSGCGDEGLGLSGFGLPGPGSCSETSWQLTGLAPGQLPEPSQDELQTARLRVGEVVSIHLESWLGGNCDSAVEHVEWLSSRPDVADLASAKGLAAELRAQRPGETLVAAELTLVSGQRERAELYTGFFGTRVFAVRVVP